MNETFPVSESVKKTYEAVKSNPSVKEAYEFLVPDQKERLEQQVTIAKIPGYSYHEEKRAALMADYFREYGLSDVHIDRFGNVSGTRKGSGNGPKILIDAHTDSVFPLYTVLEPKYEGSKVFMPGITYDASGLSAMLSVLRALNHCNISTVGDITFAGITLEEPGILGMPLYLSENKYDAVISLDCAGSDWFAVGATSETFFHIRFRSQDERINYGKYSQCLTAASRAAVKVSEITPPAKTMILADDIVSDPNRGQGCTAKLTTLTVQVRACSNEAMAPVEGILRKIAEDACAVENARFGTERVTFEIIKDEPLSPASQDWNNAICGSAYTILTDLNGKAPRIVETGNSNSGAALRIGIPAVTLGTGGEHGGIHSLGEFFDSTDMHKGPQSILTLALMMAGIDGFTAPLA